MKRKTKKRLIIAVVVAVVLISNIPILNSPLLLALDCGKLRYSNADGSFTMIGGFDVFSVLVDRKEMYEAIIRNRDPPVSEENVEIYRLYRMNPVYFWRWSYYFLVSKQYRYKNWKEIEPNRVPYDPKSRRSQDF